MPIISLQVFSYIEVNFMKNATIDFTVSIHTTTSTVALLAKAALHEIKSSRV
jgi:hypothetical protein